MTTANCPAEFFIWANALNDLQMAAVLAAYHVADGAPLSENECAAFATLTRKTARKKKHQLIELGLLYRDREFVNGQHDPCRIHRERFLQWISTAGVNLPRSEAATGVNLPRSEPPPYKERACAPAFESNPKSNKEQSIEDLRTAQKGDYEPDDFETARARLHSFQFENSRRAENRIANPPDETITAQILAMCGSLEALEDMLRTLEADRAEAGYKWVWFVRVALDRVRGLQFDDAQWKHFAAEVWPKRNGAPRKPPERETPAFDIHAQVTAMAATMGGKR